MARLGLYSNSDFTRKIKTVKDDLFATGFYDSKVVLRVITRSGASGMYNRNVTVSYTDSIISAIVEVRPEVITDEMVVETFQGDIRMTTQQVTTASSVLAASEIWVDHTFTASGGITYSGNQLADGTQYKISSHKKTLFELDHMFNMERVGKLS